MNARGLTLPKSAADYATIAVAPLLIFLMISSLVNFLMLIFYHGRFPERLSWTLLMFTLGAVGIARIAIERDRAYSLGYGGILGLITYLALLRFVDSPAFSFVILIVIAYLADVIVRDCTLIDDDVDASCQGLMDSGRLFVKQKIESSTDGESSKPEPTSKRKRKTHQPGRTIMYLALAALPLFGLGQFMLRNSPDVWSRARWLLAFYLFASLSLLVTTSFLGLRRYLRQREVEMPSDVSVGWLTGGLGVIALVLMLAYIAPLPGRAIATFEPPKWLDSPGTTVASRFGWGNEGADDSEQGDRASAEQENENQQPRGTRSEQGAPPGDSGDGDRQDGPSGEKGGGKQQSQQGSSDSQSSEQKQSGSSGDQGSQNQSQQSQSNQRGDQQQSSSESSASQQASDPNQQTSSSQESRESRSNDSSNQDQSSDESRSESSSDGRDPSNSDSGEPTDDSQSDREGSQEQRPSDGSNDESSSSEQSSDGSSSTSGQSPPSDPAGSSSNFDVVGAVSSFFKWIVFLVLAGIVGVFVWMHRELIAAWWERLFAGSETNPQTEPEIEEIIASAPRRPFASFRNPVGNEADSRKVVVITFQAFEAWTREQGTSRSKDETPAEFLRRFSKVAPNVSPAASQVVDAYNRIVYGRGRATEKDVQAADLVWREMKA